MALIGRTAPFRGDAGKVWNRRVSPVAVRPGEGLLTERTAGVQPVRRERVFMPQMRHSGTTPANHEVVWITDICVGFLHGLRCF